MKEQKVKKTHDERMASLTLAEIYPLYVAKIIKKGRTEEELKEVMVWLTGLHFEAIKESINNLDTFEAFFEKANLNLNANKIKGLICGYRVEEIENPLTQKIRYLDKLVDELAKGKKLSSILRDN
jgi:hypothetical protein